ncbi:unnamed protein product, partial [Staurois parvus]
MIPYSPGPHELSVRPCPLAIEDAHQCPSGLPISATYQCRLAVP